MTLEWTLNFLAFASLCLVGVVPILIAIKVKIPSLRIVSLLLGLFAITHGLYHLSEALGFDILSDVIFEPSSVVFLLAFGLYYSRKGVP